MCHNFSQPFHGASATLKHGTDLSAKSAWALDELLDFHISQSPSTTRPRRSQQIFTKPVLCFNKTLFDTKMEIWKLQESLLQRLQGPKGIWEKSSRTRRFRRFDLDQLRNGQDLSYKGVNTANLILWLGRITSFIHNQSMCAPHAPQ